MRVLVLDNYDSFTYNLVQYIEEILQKDIDVVRNDQIAVGEVDPYDVIVLSPGPGLPSDAGIMPELIRAYSGKKPILGVCLGHQAIGEVLGAELMNLTRVFHGIETPIHFTTVESAVFDGLPGTIRVGRYHSWVIKRGTLPPELEVIAVDDQGEIMAIQHREYPIIGLQFHPESIMTNEGKEILSNFFLKVAEPTLENTKY